MRIESAKSGFLAGMVVQLSGISSSGSSWKVHDGKRYRPGYLLKINEGKRYRRCAAPLGGLFLHAASGVSRLRAEC